jgi:hypothetical protein
MGPPLTSVSWSPDFVAQTLEIFAIGLEDGELFWMKPIHSDSLRVGLSAAAKPAAVILDVLSWYPLKPIVVHSTSWRHEDGRVILTYVAAIEPPGKLPDGSLVALPVARAEIARGDAMGPPQAIDVTAVLEHALRHISWLVRDDQAVGEALATWKPLLAAYVPEPFRALA